MTTRAHMEPTVPETTARAARHAFDRSNPYRAAGDHIREVASDLELAAMPEAAGAPPNAVMTLVTALQHAEGLSDREAAEAARTRVDWKYVLHLPLHYPGFDVTALAGFRRRLMAHTAAHPCFERVLQWLGELGLCPDCRESAPTTPRVLTEIATANRFPLLVQTMRLVLQALQDNAPEWLLATAPERWQEWYLRPSWALHAADDLDHRLALAQAVATDGFRLLDTLAAPGTPGTASSLAELEVMREVWSWQFERHGDDVVWLAA